MDFFGRIDFKWACHNVYYVQVRERTSVKRRSLYLFGLEPRLVPRLQGHAIVAHGTFSMSAKVRVAHTGDKACVRVQERFEG